MNVFANPESWVLGVKVALILVEVALLLGKLPH